jgi:hypothetical protein
LAPKPYGNTSALVESPEDAAIQHTAKNAVMMDDEFIKTPFSENPERTGLLRLETAWLNTS